VAFYVAKVVAGALTQSSPPARPCREIRLKELQHWFVIGGPAIRDILNLLARHARRGWIISNPMNPLLSGYKSHRFSWLTISPDLS
jgi:hypothetical protein